MRSAVPNARLSRRRAGWLAVLAGVLAAHAFVTGRIADSVASWHLEAQRPQRLQVAFVRELQPAAPPPATARPAAPKPRPRRSVAAVATVPAPAASAVEPAQVEPLAAQAPAEPSAVELPGADPAAGLSPDTAGPAEPPVVAEAASSPAAEPPALSAAAGEAASAPGADPVRAAREGFAWPPSSRLNYTLTGHFRGELHGSAQVEWLHVGGRYQVHLDIVIGPSFAPMFTWRISSEGRVGPGGLEPRLYQERTDAIGRRPSQASIRFEPDAIVLPDNLPRDAVPGVQDQASQFVHLIWMFTTDPALLQPGRVLELPLARPRRVETWVYDVRRSETLYPPFGQAIEAVHVQSRRAFRAGDLIPEMWFAPTLQYLPVRIRIHQNAETYLDLMLNRPPLQADTAPPYSGRPESEEAR